MDVGGQMSELASKPHLAGGNTEHAPWSNRGPIVCGGNQTPRRDLEIKGPRRSFSPTGIERETQPTVPRGSAAAPSRVVTDDLKCVLLSMWAACAAVRVESRAAGCVRHRAAVLHKPLSGLWPIKLSWGDLNVPGTKKPIADLK